MKAITTRYLAQTNTRPAHIIASDSDGNRITVPYYEINNPNPYRLAAEALCRKMNWPGADTLIEGGIKHGRVFVFPPTPDPRDALLARALPLLVQLGDAIGNGPIDPTRADSLGIRCDLIGDIHAAIGADAIARPVQS